MHHFLRFATFAMVLFAAIGTAAVPNLDRVISEQLEVVAERPTDATVHNDLGNLLVLSEQLEEAEVAYRTAIDLGPTETSPRFNLGLLLQQQERYQEAYDVLSELIEIEPEHAWAHYQLGMIESIRGDRSDALKYYAQSFALDPTLTFARNNPHIIDNELATEALLRSSRYRAPSATNMPRSYGEGARLRTLMLEAEMAGTAEGGTEEEMIKLDAERSAPQDGALSGSGNSGLTQRDIVFDDEDSAVRRPRPSDEEMEERREVSGVTIGQPVGAAGEPVRSEDRSLAPAPSPSPSRLGVDEQSRRDAIRERLRGRTAEPGVVTPRTPAGRVIDEEDGAPPVAPSPRYRPGRRSTASVDLEILEEGIG